MAIKVKYETYFLILRKLETYQPKSNLYFIEKQTCKFNSNHVVENC